MDAATFNEYLKNRYLDQLNYYEGATAKNQKKYKNIQWGLIILSTLTTIMAALPKEFDLQYVIVFTAAIVTILTSALKTFQYQELWVSYRNTIEQLKPELYLYQFNINEYGKPEIDKESLFVSRVESILGKEHDVWPANKKIKDQDTQNDESQKKLADVLKEKFNTQQNNPPITTTEIETPVTNNIPIPSTTGSGQDVTDSSAQQESATDTEQVNTKSADADVNSIDDKNEETEQTVKNDTTKTN